MNYAISISELTKQYGKSIGIDNIDLKVEDGCVFGFLGPNGAGKTTTISILVGLVAPTRGSVHIYGQDITKNTNHILRDIGFLSGDMPLDQNLTGRQQLKYYSQLRGNYDEKYISQLAKRLNCNLDRRIKTLSKGNKQKIGLISALMHKPKLLILDEPTSGLDPLMQAEFNKIIHEHKNRGGTTFISSHILSEVQEICDQLAFIKDGKLLSTTTVEALSNQSPRTVRIKSKDQKLHTTLSKSKSVKDLIIGNDNLSFSYKGDINHLLDKLSQHKLVDISIEPTDLETIFMNFYTEEGNENAK